MTKIIYNFMQRVGPSATDVLCDKVARISAYETEYSSLIKSNDKSDSIINDTTSIIKNTSHLSDKHQKG